MILFLSSGVSLESKLPSVHEVRTELIKGAEDPRLLKLFELLVELDTDYLKNSAPFKVSSTGQTGYTGQIFRAETTYEDLFYLIDQIVINGEGRKADLTVGSFVDFLCRKAKPFLKGSTEIERAVDLHYLAIDARRFIEHKVSSLLRASEVKGLDLVIKLAISPSVYKLNIITLNHDTLIEQLLTEHNIVYTDGFGKPDGDVRWFKDEFSDNIKVRIIKLHGSISWWNQAGSNVVQPVNITDQDSDKWRNKKGENIKDIGRVPSFLTGVSKVYSYNRGIFADQNYRFLQLLHGENRMIMSGYGWGDLPINFQLQNWLARDDENILILLHRDPIFLYENSPELRQVYVKYTKSKKIVPIEKWLSETSLAKIEQYL
ncbi:MAG TPA: SIR2 family protein [Anaerolineales bacterium]|nr:SIR2 family protein [Anaerolineales bacterium]